ncbi:hypothetical protein BDP27DRAFT_1007278 [Rhodocollybia butyracea]|uniref:Uncharacterized protein n=1 Tax=Rhodocollybia butyracea TaxID=206335 RepID=A0A9P5TUS0_9AGAR|nr:hypothetical protein BDP27DRAFT_1007278 [Rhodocollybia butyracea]
MTVLLASGQAASLQKMFFVVLFNSCCAANHLLRHELVHARTLHRAESSVKYLLGLFVLLVLEAGLNRRPDLNSTILESLTLVDDRTFTEALTQVCEDRKIRFVERMDEMILRTRRYLIHSVEPGNNLSNTEAEELRLVLYFVIRIWHNAEGQKRIQRQPILNLLSSLINRLSKKDIEPLSLTYLRDAAVTAFSVLDTDSTAPIKNPKQDDIWKFCPGFRELKSQFNWFVRDR